MLDDLFSHKIHATDLEEWEKTLVRLANVYEQLDGRLFDKEEMRNRLDRLAPTAARDPFRDQFSIYMSILGVGQIVWAQNEWRVRLSETAREFLLGAEPNVEAFCRLQLTLYQRPDGRGMKYEGTGSHEHSSATDKLEFIRDGYRVCPFRLILATIGAKAIVEGASEDEVVVMPEEIYALANDARIRRVPNPPIEVLAEGLDRLQRGQIEVPNIGRRTFKFLESTGLVTIDTHDNVRLRDCGTAAANDLRNHQVQTIRSYSRFFDRFHQCTNTQELVDELKSGRWAKYFDAINSHSHLPIEMLAGTTRTTRIVDDRPNAQAIAVGQAQQQPAAPAATHFPEQRPARGTARAPLAQADPEETRVIRERRNSYHDLIVRRLANKITTNLLVPQATSFIDLFTDVDSVRARLPGRFTTRGSYLENQELPYYPARASDELSFLFEAKSSDDNIVVDQVRRAVGQLYEYRYRYSNRGLRSHVVLVLALQGHLRNFPWISQYLLSDRRIGVCWLDDDYERIICPRECMPVLQPFVDDAA
jgi:hypothetical protein